MDLLSQCLTIRLAYTIGRDPLKDLVGAVLINGDFLALSERGHPTIFQIRSKAVCRRAYNLDLN